MLCKNTLCNSLFVALASRSQNHIWHGLVVAEGALDLTAMFHPSSRTDEQKVSSNYSPPCSFLIMGGFRFNVGGARVKIFLLLKIFKKKGCKCKFEDGLLQIMFNGVTLFSYI